MTIPDSGCMMENGDSCLPCTPEEEKRIIAELASTGDLNQKEGDLLYIVSNRWYADWQRYVGEDVDPCLVDQSTDNGGRVERPGPIDNADILLEGDKGQSGELEIRRSLGEGSDFVLVNEMVWKKLLEWYEGGPPLPRKLIYQGVSSNKTLYAEVYPLRLKVTDGRDQSEVVIRLSKKARLHELYEKICTLKGLDKDKDKGKVYIYDYFNKSTWNKLSPGEETLEDANLQMDQDIYFDVKDKECGSTGKELALVPGEPPRSSVTIAGGPSMSNGHSTSYNSTLYPVSTLNSGASSMDDGNDRLGSKMKGERGGLAGLQNLGNTCFMNSSLQCLVHTPLLAEFFLGDYTHEINKKNPLGMQGELAIAFGDLLRNMWSSGRSSVAPRIFKGKVARFAPQFSGYNQHDSQELLAFLLDGLHEDLNRVKQKPYIENKDSDGRPDEEYADECWSGHKARNDSIIVDMCQGQYKSTLVCPVCSKVSITFDPFMYLSLPLPSLITRTMTVTVFYGDGRALPIPYTVTVPKVGICRDLTQALSTACCLENDENLLLAEVYEHKIFRYLDGPTEPLSAIKDDERIVAYRIPKKRMGMNKIEILHNCPEKSFNPRSSRDGKFIGTPLVTYLDVEGLTAETIDTNLEKLLSCLRKNSYQSLSTAQDDKGNVFGSADTTNEIMGEETENSSMDCTKEESSERKFSFQLSLSDSRGFSSKPLEEGLVLKPNQCIRVLLDWADKENKVYDISFLEDLPEVLKHGHNAKKTRQETISLFSCLDAFLKEEPLGPEDMWYCPRCKEHQQATKKLDLWRLPEILVIHLKRFSYSRYLKNKLDTFVNFPIHNLDLSKYVSMKDNDASSSTSHMYELYAISNHYGGLGGGHYTAYAKLIDDDKWYHFDDSHVSPVSEEEIRTSAAYVLFYRRVKVGDAMQTSQGPSGASSSDTD